MGNAPFSHIDPEKKGLLPYNNCCQTDSRARLQQPITSHRYVVSAPETIKFLIIYRLDHNFYSIDRDTGASSVCLMFDLGCQSAPFSKIYSWVIMA
jgi:hypothetical protein